MAHQRRLLWYDQLEDFLLVDSVGTGLVVVSWTLQHNHSHTQREREFERQSERLRQPSQSAKSTQQTACTARTARRLDVLVPFGFWSCTDPQQIKGSSVVTVFAIP